MDTPKLGFVALKSLKQQGPRDAADVLGEIRTIYFKTSKKTIDADMEHALELLKSLPDEESREKATVYMHGLSEMQQEWRGKKKPGTRKNPRTRKPEQ